MTHCALLSPQYDVEENEHNANVRIIYFQLEAAKHKKNLMKILINSKVVLTYSMKKSFNLP